MLLTELLTGLARAAPALPGAACRTAREVFDDDSREAEALSVCRRCPDLEPCRAWISELPAARRPGGVIAGERWPIPVAFDDTETTVRDRITVLARTGPVTAELVAQRLGLDVLRVRTELSRHPNLRRVSRGVYSLKAS